MIFLIYIQNLKTIGALVSEIICLIKIDTDRWTDRQTETRDLFFRTLKVMKLRENTKLESRPMDSLTILSISSGSKNETWKVVYI